MLGDVVDEHTQSQTRLILVFALNVTHIHSKKTQHIMYFSFMRDTLAAGSSRLIMAQEKAVVSQFKAAPPLCLHHPPRKEVQLLSVSAVTSGVYSGVCCAHRTPPSSKVGRSVPSPPPSLF